ncbi:MAG: CDP-diacylglycerol--glycerol-3-phosphate 3-phosphatidyltransferase [Actinomycetota bacterium]
MTTADDRAAAFLTAITYLRIALTPVVMALVIADTDPSWARPAAALLFAFAAATDFFDGRLARRWKKTSALGNFLDTTADKLLVSGVLLALVDVGHVSAWIAFVIVGRELIIMGLRGVISAHDGTAMPPSIWGKLKANVQFIAIVLAISWPAVTVGGNAIADLAMWIAAVVTVASAVEYLARFRGLLTRRGAGTPGV